MTHRRMIRLVSMLTVIAWGCGGRPDPATAKSEAPPARAAPAVGGGAGQATLTGKAIVQGSVSAAAKIKMDADPVCQQQHSAVVHAQEIVATGGALQYVFVYVKSGLEGKTFPVPTDPVVFDQQGCLYEPHVLGVRAGQPVRILNSDATLHNVNAKPTQSAPFNLAMPTKGMTITKTFAKPEIMVPVKCNVHPWMHAYIGVVDHPFFAVSGADGTFAIPGLPAGTYTVEAWHERLGTVTETVTVADGDSPSLAFTFKTQ